MNDMSRVIEAKSDQLNADDLLGGPITITITRVDVRDGGEQPVSVHYEGDNGKPWKPCKSMARVLVNVWGIKPQAYVGQQATLYREPTVKWAGMEVGGIRISHMSGLKSSKDIPLTVTKGSKKMTTIQPLAGKQSPPPPPKAPPPPPPPKSDGGIDMGDDEPSGFPFTLQDKNGVEHVMRGDGAKWSKLLISAMSKAFDQAKRTWDANEEYVKAAEEGGETTHAKAVRDHWEMRERQSKDTGGAG